MKNFKTLEEIETAMKDFFNLFYNEVCVKCTEECERTRRACLKCKKFSKLIEIISEKNNDKDIDE